MLQKEKVKEHWELILFTLRINNLWESILSVAERRSDLVTELHVHKADWGISPAVTYVGTSVYQLHCVGWLVMPTFPSMAFIKERKQLYVDLLLPSPAFPVEADQEQYHKAPRNPCSWTHTWQRSCQHPQVQPSHSCQTMHLRSHPQQKTLNSAPTHCFVDVTRHLNHYHILESLATQWPWSFSKGCLFSQFWQHFTLL